ncbi:uncharacterized protein LOC62_01G001520 [Vanrija pseudolonga]|uniref:N-acetyltransferase domain-containing protein n=1 Tax=Vanrija pseudolonga TaxID=143232 RepID=A0AAF1BND5_9TREE|nr:hypothetical protein LOC62_01G001520 [Vanrija pseudolonga]
MTADYSDLTIVRCTPEQADIAITNTYEAWGEGMPLEPYRAHFHSIQTAGGPWAGDRWRRDALILPPGDSTPRKGTCYGVAAVYTRPEHRKKGYARHMCQLLHYVLADSKNLPPFPTAWGAPPDAKEPAADFSVLFSGVGRDFYANCTIGNERPGWVYQPIVARTWTVSTAEPANLDGVELVKRDGLAAVEEEMGRRLARDLNGVGDATKTRVAIHPHALLRFLEQFSGNKKADSTNALFFPPDADGERPFVAYVIAMPEEGKPERLIVTHVSHTARASVPFAAVQHVAQLQGAKEIEVWGDAGWDTEGSPRLESDVHTPAIATYALDNVEWEYIEE